MIPEQLAIRELAAWDFDEAEDRGSYTPEQFQHAVSCARRRLEEREPYRAVSPISVEQTHHLTNMFAARKEAVAQSGEFDDLAWELAVVDLQKLIAFQRRIGFTEVDQLEIQQGDAWKQLLDLALPAHASTKSPYIEVASYGGRWFLRDGYHRSFRLLKRGTTLVPAVVVYAEKLAQMGAVGRQFFAEEVLFSTRPPMVTDFLDEEMVLCYLRSHRRNVTQTQHVPVEAGRNQQEGL